MTNEELMLGDWVKDKYKLKPHQVDSWADFNSSEDLSPIPLEKNGFEGSPVGDMYLHIELWEQCHLKVELYPSEGSSVFVYRDKAPIDMYVSHMLLHINYVHELQHALRLCGLNELADNFKI